MPVRGGTTRRRALFTAEEDPHRDALLRLCVATDTRCKAAGMKRMAGIDRLYRRIHVASALCLAAACTTLAGAQPSTYRVDPDATLVEYVATALGVIKQRGRFARVRGVIVLDLEAERGQVDFAIDARSIDSGWSVRDGFLQDEPMLDASHHPAIRFRSTRLVFVAGRLAKIEGALTLRGITRSVELVVTRFACRRPGDDANEACEAAAAATIRRSDFDMDSFAPLIGDDVELEFVIVARRSPEPAR